MKKRLATLGAVLAFGAFALPALTFASALTSTQVNAILTLLQSFGADSSTIASVQSALTGTAPQPASNCVDLSQDLTLGSTDSSTADSVTKLQSFLQSQGYFTYQGAKGYYGFITAQAVGQYQMAKGLVSSSADSAYGIVGAQTRNAMGCGDQNNTQNPHPGTFTAKAVTGNGLRVQFDVAGAFYSEFSSISFGDGTNLSTASSPSADNEGCTAAAWDTVCTMSHTYAQAGTYTATLLDASGNSLATQTITITGSQNQPSATIDQSSLLQNDGTFSVTGSAQNTNEVYVFLVPSSVTARDYVTVNGQLGKDGVFKSDSFVGGASNQNKGLAEGIWTAPFTWNGVTTTFEALVYDAASKALIASGALTVQAPSQMTFSASPTSGSAPLTVNFSGIASGTTYSIDFGDGSAPLGAHLSCDPAPGATSVVCGPIHVSGTHVYAKAGSYTATLSAGTQTKTVTITVAAASAAPTCSITVNPNPAVVGQPTKITINSTNTTGAQWVQSADYQTLQSHLGVNIPTGGSIGDSFAGANPGTYNLSAQFTGTDGSTITCPFTLNLTAAASLPVPNVSYPANNSVLTFDGTRFNTTAALPSSQAFTVASWVKLANSSGGVLLSDATAAVANDMLFGVDANHAYIRADKSGAALAGAGMLGSYSVALPSSIAGAWHHLVWVNDGQSSTVYLDGAVAGTVAKTGSNIGYQNAISVGAFWDGQDGFYAHGAGFFTGSLAQLQYYTTALSADQVSQLYNGGADKPAN